jgi:hypothetical protein
MWEQQWANLHFIKTVEKEIKLRMVALIPLSKILERHGFDDDNPHVT